MTRRVVAILAPTVTALVLTSGAASATLPPDDTAGTDFIRDQAEAAATEFFAAADPSVAGVACEVPTADSAGVAIRCYATTGIGEVVTATATINDYGDIEMSQGGGPVATTSTTPPSTMLASYSGEGSAARPVDPITAPTIVRVTHAGAGEFSVQPQHGGVAVGEPIVTTTGVADGRYLVGLGGTISAFAITADGAWTLELHAISSAVPLAPGTPAAGVTPDVVAYASAEAGPVTLEYTGTGPVVVRAVTSAGPTVVVDEATAFTGEVTLPAGPGQLLVDAVGSWTISFPAPTPTSAAPTTAAATTASPTSAAPTTAAPPTASPPTTAAPTTSAP
jgi:hypothetical protein